MKTQRKIPALMWTLVFFIDVLFQLFRGSPEDAIIYAVATILLFLEYLGVLPTLFPAKPQIPRRIIIAFVGICAAILFFIEQTSRLNELFFFVLAPILLLLISYPEKPIPARETRFTRAAWLWSSLAIAVSIMEMVAFFLAEKAGDMYSYPTLSVIIYPQLVHPWWRVVFLVLWMYFGVSALRLWERK